MIVSEVKSLVSVDLEGSAADPEDCYLGFEAEIGPRGGEGAELFQFEVVTPKALAREDGPRWGREMLIVRFFSFGAVESALEKLLAHCHRKTWEEVAQELNKELLREFDGYQEYEPGS